MQAGIKERNRQIGALVKEFAEQTVGFYNEMDAQPVFNPAAGETLEALERQTIPEEGRPVREVYSEMLRDIYANTFLAQHPRSFACVPSTASLLSWLGDVMTSAYNPHASCRINAPAGDLIEKKLIGWMGGLAGYPKGCGGLFVSGGSIANLTALTAARDAKLAWEERGNAVVYVSDQTHASVAKGLHIIGFRRDQIRTLPTDAAFCMELPALEAAVREDLKNGKRPFAVVASAGTTNTGSVDPLPEIAALCRRYDMWMHVDGAFGASVLLSGHYRDRLSGIGLSDSLSWDAHKWMLQTYGCSVVLVRDPSCLADSFAAHPEYLRDSETDESGVEFWDLGPELTRPARSLKLWLTLQTAGSRELGSVIDHGCRAAKLAERLIRENGDWEIVSPAQFGIVNVRYVSDGTLSDADLDRINQEISRRITQSGFSQIFTTELRGKKVLRLCTIHPETTETDIRDTIKRLQRLGDVCCRALAGGRPGNAVPVSAVPVSAD